MKMLGFATDIGPPADFVAKSRPQNDPDYIPIFQTPAEPDRPALSAKELGTLKGDLDSVEKQHGALRQANPAAAKTAVEQQAARGKAKSNAPDARQ